MDFTTALISILTIHMMASISPGPDFVVVSQRTFKNGRRAGVMCGLGVCAGLLVHISYSVIGLSSAFNHSDVLMKVIGILGGTYLVYLGYKSFASSYKEKAVSTSNEERKRVSSSAFFSGLLVNIFNPKAAVYFLSLFSVVISPSIGADKIILVTLLIIAVQMTWYLTFIFFVTIPRVKVVFDKYVHMIDRVLGVLMAMMGAYMLVTNL